MINIEAEINEQLKRTELSSDERSALEGLLLVVHPLAQKFNSSSDYDWNKQADKLAYLFARDLGQSRQQYIDVLPRFSNQPEAYKGRPDIPTLVQVPTEKL